MCIRSMTDALILMIIAMPAMAMAEERSQIVTVKEGRFVDTVTTHPVYVTVLYFPDKVLNVINSQPDRVMDNLIDGVRLQDMTAGVAIELPPCSSCAPGEYRIPPRRSPKTPRIVRVTLMTTDLGVLAPQKLGVSSGPFADVTLTTTTSITGRVYDEALIQCLEVTGGVCTLTNHYRHYRAVLHGYIFVDKFSVDTLSRASLNLPANRIHDTTNLLGRPVEYLGFSWETGEETDLDDPIPQMHPGPIECSVP